MYIVQWNLSNPDTIKVSLIERLVAFGTDESVLFREVSLIQGVLIERFHCIYFYIGYVLVQV